MIIRVEKNQKIFSKNNLDLRPVLNNITSSENEEYYHYTFFVGIDRRSYENNNISYIGVSLSGKNSIADKKNKNIGKSFFDEQKSYKNPGSIVNTIQKGLNKKFVEIINYNRRLSTLTTRQKKYNLSFEVMSNIISKNSKNDIEKYGEVLGYKTVKVKEKYRFDPSVQVTIDNFLDRKIYKKNIQGDVPNKNLLLSSDDFKKYQKRPIVSSKRYASIPISMTIKKSDLQLIKSDQLYFMINFTAKNSRDEAIDSQVQLINHGKHLRFFNIRKINFENFSYILERNAMYAGIKNILMLAYNIDIKGKIFISSMSKYHKDRNYYKVFDNVNIENRTLPVNNPFVENSVFNKAIQNKNTTINSRITYNIDNLEYSNFKEQIVVAPGMNDKVFVPFYVIQENYNNEPCNKIIVPSEFISPTLNRINILRRKSYSGQDFEEDFNYSKTFFRKEILDSFVSFNESVNIEDKNIKNNTTYEYKLELYYDNRKKVISSNTFATKVAYPTNIVNLSINKITQKNIELNVAIEKNDSEKVFNQLFGNLFELFKEDFKEIRNLTARSILIKVDRINSQTGEILEYKSFPVNENNICTISIDNPDNLSFIYKIKSCVKSLAESITSLKKNLISDKLYKPGETENFASLVSKVNNTSKNVVSTVGNKYTKKDYFRRSLIGIENNNLFDDAETGDNLYVTDFLSIEDNQTTTIEDIYYIKYDDKVSLDMTYELPDRSSEESIYIITIIGVFENNADHFDIVYYQNGVMHHGEKGHIDKESNTHNLLLKCPKGIGEKNIYCYIVDKNGIPISKEKVRRR